MLNAVRIVFACVLAGVSVAECSAPAAATETFRVATFNIHKGATRAGRYDLQGIIEAIAKLRVDAIGLQEVIRHHPGLQCDDQPALIAAGLTRATGRKWDYVFATAFTMPDATCPGADGGKVVSAEGEAIFTPGTIISATELAMVEQRVALMVEISSLPGVPIVTTHLAAWDVNQPRRVEEVRTLLPWMSRRSGAILLADLNAEPEAPEIAPLFARYRDAWGEAAATRRTNGIASGETEIAANHRIDYVLWDRSSPLALESADVVDTRGVHGEPDPSDHRPLVATFTRR